MAVRKNILSRKTLLTKNSFELLIYEHICHVVLQIEDLNEEIKLSGVDKSSVLGSLRDCKSKLEESEMLRDRLTSRMDTLFKKIESEERERETLLQQVDRLNQKVIMQEWIYWGEGGCAGLMAYRRVRTLARWGTGRVLFCHVNIL